MTYYRLHKFKSLNRIGVQNQANIIGPILGY